jgi:hypothetical protein
MRIRAIISTGILIAVVVILALCRPVPAFAVSTVTISSTGDGVFLLQGIGIEDAAAFEIIASYDTSTLANPRVVAGPLISGAMTAINPNIPGMVRMVIVRLTPVKGSGVIATLTFDRKGSSPGTVTSLNARLANIHGGPLPALVQVNNPPDTSVMASNLPQGQEAPAGTPTSGQPAGTTGTPSIIAPTVILAGPPSKADEGNVMPDIQGQKEKEAQTTRPESRLEPQKEEIIVARKTDGTSDVQEATSFAKVPARKIFSQKGTLNRFKEYRGERTAMSLVSLFEREQESFIGFRQEPPVALSDGKSLVRVTFISTPGNKTSSDVAVMGARFISMERDPDNTNTWIVELEPERGVYRASLTVSQGEIAMVYPITIAPKIDIALAHPGGMTEADVDLYLKERGKAGAQASDLNKDGRLDYIDDYILTINYVVESMEKARLR